MWTSCVYICIFRQKYIPNENSDIRHPDRESVKILKIRAKIRDYKQGLDICFLDFFWKESDLDSRKEIGKKRVIDQE